MYSYTEAPRRHVSDASFTTGIVSTCHQRHQVSDEYMANSNLMVESSRNAYLAIDPMLDRDANPQIEPLFPSRSKSSVRHFHSVENEGTVSDEEAAMQMESCFKMRCKRRKDHLTERIFWDLINREAALDDESIHNFLYAADKIIFNGMLSGRVRWRWSNECESRYKDEHLGTTFLWEAPHGGFETVIVLSYPLLHDEQYNRDLLLSAFLHELVHCYLFIRCGLKHATDGGHTQGFRKIAWIIDEWIERQRAQNGHRMSRTLYLQNMRASLDHFRKGGRTHDVDGYAGPDVTFIDEGYVSGMTSPASGLSSAPRYHTLGRIVDRCDLQWMEPRPI